MQENPIALKGGDTTKIVPKGAVANTSLKIRPGGAKQQDPTPGIWTCGYLEGLHGGYVNLHGGQVKIICRVGIAPIHKVGQETPRWGVDWGHKEGEKICPVGLQIQRTVLLLTCLQGPGDTGDGT